MHDQGEFFSPGHKQLLNLALWAKYLAWIVFAVNLLFVFGVVVQEQTYYNAYGMQSGLFLDFPQMLDLNPWFEASLYVEMLSVFFRGVVYFLVLRGISLGLNMIVETDINYREKKNPKGAS